MGIATQYEGGLKFDGDQMYITTSGGTTLLTLGNTGNATFAGTISSGAITSTGQITGTELEGTSLDINGSADISGNITGVDNLYADKVYINSLQTLATSSNFLYIDPSGSFGSGIYINNAVRVDGGLLGSYNEDLQLRTGTTTRLTLSNSDGSATFAGKVRANNWFQGADGTNTLYANSTAGVLIQTPGSTANNNDSKIYFRNHGTTVKHTFDTNSGDATFANNVYAQKGVFSDGMTVTGDMSSFETTLTNNEDWQNSPISILERGNVQGTETADKYSPNLNFHWGGVVSKSLWMGYNGHLNWGEYSSTGIPAADGRINATFFGGELLGTINTATTGATQTAGDNSTKIATTAYADAAAAAGGGNFLPLAGGTMTGNVIFPGEEANSFKIAFTGASASSGLSTVDQSGAGLYIGANSRVNNSGVVVFHDTLLPSSGIYFDGWNGDDMEFYTGSSGNPTKRLTIEAGGDAIFTGNVSLADSKKLIFGAGDDLQIFHNGSNSHIETSNTSVGDFFVTARGTNHDLYLEAADNIYIRPQGNENGIVVVGNGGVTLYHNNVAKLETTSTGVTVTGDIKVDSALLSHQENTDVDTGTETVASVLIATYTAAFFDFVIKNGTNLRAGTVFACHDGTNVVYTETSTNDLGDTSDVTLSVDISGTDMRLRATVTSDDWSVKSLIRAI